MPELPVNLHYPRTTWLLCGVIGVGLLSFGFAHVAERLRATGGMPMGMGTLAFGALAGVSLGWAARRLHVTLAPFFMISTALLIVSGEAAQTMVTYRMGADQLEAQFRKDPLGNAAEQFLAQQQSPADDAATVTAREKLLSEMQRIQDVRRARLSFASFLTNRVKTLGRLPLYAATLIWSVEALVGTALGMWLAQRAPSPPQPARSGAD